MEEKSQEAISVHQFSLEQLAETGLPPSETMSRFETWLKAEVPAGYKPVFVAFNAPFDWMYECAEKTTLEEWGGIYGGVD